jgi:hypothetical protein
VTIWELEFWERGRRVGSCGGEIEDEVKATLGDDYK